MEQRHAVAVTAKDDGRDGAGDGYEEHGAHDVGVKDDHTVRT